jgi:hypothetical protein
LSENLSSLLGDHGEPMKLRVGERTYEARVLSQTKKSAIERQFKAKALQPFLDLQASEAGADGRYDRAVAVASDRFSSGAYGFYSERCMNWLGTIEGGVILGATIFEITEAEMLDLLAAANDEVSRILDTILDESFPQKKKSDPNSQRPAGDSTRRPPTPTSKP